jgi:hypothetical protein
MLKTSGQAWRTRAEDSHDSIDVLSLDAVDDVVAGTRDEVTAGHDFDLRLVVLSDGSSGKIIYNWLSYSIAKLLHQTVILIRQIAGIDSVAAGSVAVMQ